MYLSRVRERTCGTVWCRRGCPDHIHFRGWWCNPTMGGGRDGDGHTPLFLAAVMGRTGTVGYLLSRGADPNAGSYTTLTGPSSYSSRPTMFISALPPHPRAFLLLAAADIYLPHCRRRRGPSSFFSRRQGFMLGIATAAEVCPPSPCGRRSLSSALPPWPRGRSILRIETLKYYPNVDDYTE